MEVCIMYGFLSYTNLFQSAPYTLQGKQHDFIMYSSELDLSSLQHTENQAKCSTMILQNKCAASRQYSSWKIFTWQKIMSEPFFWIFLHPRHLHTEQDRDVKATCTGCRCQLGSYLMANVKKNKLWFSDLCVSELTPELQRPLKLV